MNDASLPGLAGARLLVVEDSWHIAFAIETVLQSEGAVVLGPAPSIAEAQKLMASEPFELALVDVNLNGEMAYPLIDALIARGTRVLVMSGYDIDDKLRAKVAGVIEKPFDPAVLVTTVRSLVTPR